MNQWRTCPCVLGALLLTGCTAAGAAGCTAAPYQPRTPPSSSASSTAVPVIRSARLPKASYLRIDPLVVLGGLCYLVAAWQLGHIDAFTGAATVLLLAGLISLGSGTTLFPAVFTISLSEQAAVARIPSGIVRRLAFVQLMRFSLSYVGATTVAQWRGTRVTIHAADLARQGSSHTLSALAARYVQQGATRAAAPVQALAALVQGIQTQATVLALQDVGALIILVVVGSSAVLGLVALSTAPQLRTVLRRIW